MRPRMEEGARSLVLFTVLSQAAAGTTWLGLFAFPSAPGRALPLVALVLLVVGGGAALLHLERPRRASLALANLRTSWLSREVLLGGLFAAALIAWLLAGATGLGHGLAVATAILALLFVLAVASVYRLRTVPAWDTWATPSAFLLTAVVLGGVLGAAVLAARGDEVGMRALALIAAAGMGLQLGVGLGHLVQLSYGDTTEAASARSVYTEHGRLLTLRLGTALLAGGLLLAVTVGAGPGGGTLLLAVAATAAFASELIGRALFYASHRRVGL